MPHFMTGKLAVYLPHVDMGEKLISNLESPAI